MSNYNLDDTPESFSFTLKGNDYQMRYPNTEELEELPKAPDTKDMPEDAKQLALKEHGEKMNAYFFAFITPVKPDAPSIEDVLKKATTKVLQRFGVMIKEELSIEV